MNYYSASFLNTVYNTRNSNAHAHLLFFCISSNTDYNESADNLEIFTFLLWTWSQERSCILFNNPLTNPVKKIGRERMTVIRASHIIHILRRDRVNYLQACTQSSRNWSDKRILARRELSVKALNNNNNDNNKLYSNTMAMEIMCFYKCRI